MSIYQFLPPQNLLFNHSSYVWQENIFSDNELNQIEKIGDGLNFDDGFAADENNEINSKPNVRKCKVGWIKRNNETEFIYEKIGSFVSWANSYYFDFDLFGFTEDFQYTIYDGNESHYGWHLDIPSAGNFQYRKLSLVLQLSNPVNYEGGELEIFTSSSPTTLRKQRGIVHLFPSYILHRVTPVTSGIRKTMVVWTTGKRFK